MTNHRLKAKEKAPRTVVLIDRESFTLSLFRLGKDGVYRRTKFGIAIGRVGDATPSGSYFVDAKTRTPAWKIPEHPDYPPESWGKIVPFTDEHNPFEGGFLSLSDEGGVGIHGVRFDPKIGERASHGCIRVKTEDILHLYPLISLGTPVIII